MAVHGPPGSAVIATEGILLTITALLLIARLYLRLKISRQRLFVGDLLICLAWVATTISCSVDLVFMRLGVLRGDLDYLLNGFDGSDETLQSAMMVGTCRSYYRHAR